MPKITADDRDKLVELVDEALEIHRLIGEAMMEERDWADPDQFAEVVAEKVDSAVHLRRLRRKLTGEKV